MENYENKEIQNMNEGDEIYVTNGVIKATDIMAAIGSGLFLAGTGMFAFNQWKKKKLINEQKEFKARMINGILKDNSLSDEKKKNAIELFNKIVE